MFSAIWSCMLELIPNRYSLAKLVVGFIRTSSTVASIVFSHTPDAAALAAALAAVRVAENNPSPSPRHRPRLRRRPRRRSRLSLTPPLARCPGAATPTARLTGMMVTARVADFGRSSIGPRAKRPLSAPQAEKISSPKAVLLDFE